MNHFSVIMGLGAVPLLVQAYLLASGRMSPGPFRGHSARGSALTAIAFGIMALSDVLNMTDGYLSLIPAILFAGFLAAGMRLEGKARRRHRKIAHRDVVGAGRSG